MKFVYGCIANDMLILENNLCLPGRIKSEFFMDVNCERATVGLNKILKRMMEIGDADAFVFLHQDCIIPPGWEEKLSFRLSELKDWTVAGLWGLDENDAFAGAIYDIRIWPYLMKSVNLPRKAITLDEVCLIVNAKHCFKFDENITGFDLYGTNACCEVKKNGGNCFIVDAPIMHNTRRSFNFCPDDEFRKNLQYLKNKYKNLKIRSTSC